MGVMRIVLVFSIWLVLYFPWCEGVNKYSAEANIKDTDENISNIRSLENPFRMSKLNTLWKKAVLRISEPKLKSLYSDLKLQDKEEIMWKKMKAEGLDNDGLREAEIRRKLMAIMNTYDLLEHFEDRKEAVLKSTDKTSSDSYLNKSIFKDKKLKKLWEKAEKAGFTVAELQALKEEFSHHQEKIDQYYNLLKDVEDENSQVDENSVDYLDRYNSLNEKEAFPKEKDYNQAVNELRDKHRDIKDSYDRLHRITARGPNSKEFIEPKVEGLWRLAVNGNFTPEELESLRVELLHYENRLLKLRHLQAEAVLGAERRNAKSDLPPGDKSPGLLEQEMLIKKQARKVEKMHTDLENRILTRHTEL